MCEDARGAAPALEGRYQFIYGDITFRSGERRRHGRRHLRNLPAEVHRALKLRAAAHARSTEAEIRAILEAAVRPEGRLRLGSALTDLARGAGLANADLEALEAALETGRDPRPAAPIPLA